AEEQTGWREDPGGAELHGAASVAVAIEDVGVRDDEGDPQVAPPIVRGGANRRTYQRNLAFIGLPRRPGVWQVRDELVDLAALNAPLEHLLSGRVVLADHRLAGLEH